MADIVFKCAGCSAPLAVETDIIGQIIECPDCKQKVVVPNPGVIFACPKCQAELAATPGMAGERVGCPICEASLTVPTACSDADGTPPPTVGTNQSQPSTGRLCPGCGKPVPPTSANCLVCGVDLRTGKPKLTMKKDVVAGTGTRPNPRQAYRPPRPATDAGLSEAEESLARVRGSPRAGQHKEVGCGVFLIALSILPLLLSLLGFWLVFENFENVGGGLACILFFLIIGAVPLTMGIRKCKSSASSLPEFDRLSEQLPASQAASSGSWKLSDLASVPPTALPAWHLPLLDGLDAGLLMKWDNLRDLITKGTGCKATFYQSKDILEAYISGIRPGTPLDDAFVERTSSAIVLDIGKVGRGDHRWELANIEWERQKKSLPWWKTAPPQPEPYDMDADDVGQTAEPDSVTINPRTLEEVGHHSQIEFNSEVRKCFGTEQPWLYPDTILIGGMLLCFIRAAATGGISDEAGASTLAFKSIAPCLHERIHEKLASLIRETAGVGRSRQAR